MGRPRTRRRRDLLPAPRPRDLGPLPALRQADLPRLHARRRGRASSAPTASRRARGGPARGGAVRRTQVRRPAADHDGPDRPQRGGVAGDRGDRLDRKSTLIDRLALLPTGRCSSVDDPGSYYPRLDVERLCDAAADGRWFPRCLRRCLLPAGHQHVRPRADLAHRLQHARALVPLHVRTSGPPKCCSPSCAFSAQCLGDRTNVGPVAESGSVGRERRGPCFAKGIRISRRRRARLRPHQQRENEIQLRSGGPGTGQRPHGAHIPVDLGARWPLSSQPRLEPNSPGNGGMSRRTRHHYHVGRSGLDLGTDGRRLSTPFAMVGSNRQRDCGLDSAARR